MSTHIPTNSHLQLKALTLRTIVGSSLTWFILTIATILYAIIAVCLLLLPLNIRRRFIVSWCVVFMLCCKYLCGLDFVLDGQDNIPKSPAIFASNHQSMWETMALATFLPPYTVILKKELLWLPFFGWALATIFPIAINRSNRVRALAIVLEEGCKRVQKGLSILIFPEGTRVAPKVNAHYKTGAAKLALNLSLPIVPIAHNAGYYLPKHSFFIYPGIITVRIGSALMPMASESPEGLTERLKQSINELL